MATRIYFRHDSRRPQWTAVVKQDFDTVQKAFEAMELVVFEDAESREFDKRIAINMREVAMFRPERVSI